MRKLLHNAIQTPDGTLLVSRGGRGKDGKQTLKYVALKDIDDEWLEAIIKYEEFHRPGNIFLEFYHKEKEFRKSLA